ncbi:MAG: hypothetical protein M1573_01505 [Candidatus Parvarchaeota archaeon]|jgi:hypothetical protein|nr:hypothetical protein [Candidatus Parvarchaeota archaeon]MCL5017898.1 hypothetical protein [Candidatus Parvarchaeota archaeon]
MLRRVSALIIRDDFVLLVKLKEQDRLIPRATWVFPFIDLDPDASPRKAISDMLSKFKIDYSMTDKVFKYSPSENPKLNYFLYVVKYSSGDPDVTSSFQTYKWVKINDITAYSTSFMDGNVSKYLNEIVEKNEKRRPVEPF